MVRVESTRLILSHLIPDLLFADLPPEMLFRTKVSSPNHFLVSLEERLFGGVAPPPSESTGMFVQPYYSFDDADVFIRKPAGALKAVSYQWMEWTWIDIVCVAVLPAVMSDSSA